MNWQGWIFMLIAWSFVSGLFFYSFYRILFDSRFQNIHAKTNREKGKNH